MKKNPWCVYILRCSDGSFYTGITKNIVERLKTHNAGNGAKYTRGKRPVSLVYKERQANQPSAMKRERQIKKWERRNKEKLVREFARRKSGKIHRLVPALSGLARDKGGS